MNRLALWSNIGIINMVEWCSNAFLPNAPLNLPNIGPEGDTFSARVILRGVQNVAWLSHNSQIMNTPRAWNWMSMKSARGACWRTSGRLSPRRCLLLLKLNVTSANSTIFYPPLLNRSFPSCPRLPASSHLPLLLLLVFFFIATLSVSSAILFCIAGRLQISHCLAIYFSSYFAFFETLHDSLHRMTALSSSLLRNMY